MKKWRKRGYVRYTSVYTAFFMLVGAAFHEWVEGFRNLLSLSVYISLLARPA